MAAEETKTCSDCESELPLVQFTKNKATSDGLQYRCRVCVSAYDKAYRKNNHARKALTNKIWYGANKEHKAIYNSTWYSENTEYKRESVKAWQIANPDKRTTYYQFRRALQASVTVESLPVNVKEVLISLYGDYCLYPGCIETRLTLDHIIPLSKGGGHSMDNFQLLCGSHNSSKGIKTIDYRHLRDIM